jgi:hypothetical protein
MRIEKIFLATLITIVFIAAITVSAELYPPLKNWLKETFYHHWVGKGILALAIFGAISFLGPSVDIKLQEKLFIPVTTAAVLAIFTFFILHFLKVF